jgi:hypothetical protein
MLTEGSMSTKLTFKVESHGRPYAVLVLKNGLVTAHMGRLVLRHAMLPSALQWVQAHNPDPAIQPSVTVVGRFRG